MKLLFDLNLLIHIVAGTTTLLTGPFAIFYNFRDVRRHRIVGKVFYYAMLVVAVSAIFSFFRHPDELFARFLLGIALLVLAGIFRGVRSIFWMKGASVGTFDWAYTALLGANALYMLGMSGWLITQDANPAFSVLFGIFGFMSAADTRINLKTFSNPGALHRLDWLRLHLSTMLGAFTASTTAFTVNAAPFLPWWAQWFGPTLLLLPFQFYFAKKVKTMMQSTP
jgi:uncharacterized membrane protein